MVSFHDAVTEAERSILVDEFQPQTFGRLTVRHTCTLNSDYAHLQWSALGIDS